MKTENRRYIGITHSACPVCRKVIPARTVCSDDSVYFQKFCPEHGPSEAKVYGDPEYFLTCRRFVKPAVTPEQFSGDEHSPCTEGCGFCSRHEQHLCMPIFEVTSRCNLACPICLNSSGGGRDCTLEEFRTMLDAILAAEKQVDVMNISGGEPLMHPEILALIDEALRRPGIIRVSISTNGLLLIENPVLIAELKKRDVVVSLQFDGHDDDTALTLRGRHLADDRRRIIKLLSEADVTMSLTMTIMGGVNVDAVRDGMDLLFSHENIVSLMLQPAAFVGRGASFQSGNPRVSIPDVIDSVDRNGRGVVRKNHFVPLPCSHPQCFSLAYYLKLNDGKYASITDFTDIAGVLDNISNRVVFGLDPAEHRRLKDMIYDLWSGPAAMVPENEQILKTLKNLLKQFSSQSCGCFDPRQTFGMMERHVKSIFIHAFQDVATFDLERVRRCCHSYPQPDGSLIPACVRNVIRTDLLMKESAK